MGNASKVALDVQRVASDNSSSRGFESGIGSIERVVTSVLPGISRNVGLFEPIDDGVGDLLGRPYRVQRDVARNWLVEVVVSLIAVLGERPALEVVALACGVCRLLHWLAILDDLRPLQRTLGVEVYVVGLHEYGLQSQIARHGSTEIVGLILPHKLPPVKKHPRFRGVGDLRSRDSIAGMHIFRVDDLTVGVREEDEPQIAELRDEGDVLLDGLGEVVGEILDGAVLELLVPAMEARHALRQLRGFRLRED